jgi:hypothetical protein
MHYNPEGIAEWSTAKVPYVSSFMGWIHWLLTLHLRLRGLLSTGMECMRASQLAGVNSKWPKGPTNL